LCDPNGSNAAYLNLFPFPCPIGTYGDDSMQEQLNLFIAAKLKECVKLDSIEKITDLKITAGTPNVSVLFGEDEVTAMATYPLNMNLGKYTSTRFFDFQMNIPVRLKKVFGLADFLAKNDVYDISFNTTKDYIKYKYFGKDLLPPMSVNRSRVPGPGGQKVDIIEINDTSSIIEGKPYLFRFAVENRIPALDPIPEPRQTEDSFDFVVVEGDTIKITPKAYDPDDNDQITYSYHGWKADEDAAFDPAKCFGDYDNDKCKSDPYFAVDDAGSIMSSEWTPVAGTAGEEGAVEYQTKTKYDDDAVTNGCDPSDASCTRYSRDLGAHNVTVEACDEGDLCDYQIVRIIVTDTPSPNINTYNYYGMHTQTASIEDPFVLDSSGSCIFCQYISYTWQDSYDFSFNVPSDVPYDNLDGKVTIPVNPDIATIKSSDNFFKTVEDDHTLTLTIPAGSADKSTATIDVQECVVHDHTIGGKPAAPYPYNDNSETGPFNNPLYADDPETNADPFKADHTCCDAGEYIAADQKQICYKYNSYGSFLSIDKTRFISSLGGSSWQRLVDDTTSASVDKNMQNDIFLRHFERYCSGDRGNICSGDAIETIEVVKQCADFDDNTIKTDYVVNGLRPNQLARQTERCQGINPVFKNQESTAILNTCSIFTNGKTFESEFGMPGAKGRCSNTPACSSGEGDNRFGDGGAFRCAYAYCDGDSNDADGKHCDYGVNCNCDTLCGSDPQCNGLAYDLIKNGGPNGHYYCDNKCKVVEPDTNSEACKYAEDKTHGDEGKVFDTRLEFELGLRGSCCGDDAFEFYKKSSISSDSTYACCDNIGDCVFNGVCASSGSNSNGPNNDNQNGVCAGSKKVCANGLWKDDYSEIPDYETICT
ncbi:MAG: hypothetical protein NT001_05960, partial [Candidatus Woesearchaeota archaeon]|nr:hypothetical protein [Candidatus Woesearchaeota archaeon]